MGNDQSTSKPWPSFRRSNRFRWFLLRFRSRRGSMSRATAIFTLIVIIHYSRRILSSCWTKYNQGKVDRKTSIYLAEREWLNGISSSSKPSSILTIDQSNWLTTSHSANSGWLDHTRRSMIDSRRRAKRDHRGIDWIPITARVDRRMEIHWWRELSESTVVRWTRRRHCEFRHSHRRKPRE